MENVYFSYPSAEFHLSNCFCLLSLKKSNEKHEFLENVDPAHLYSYRFSVGINNLQAFLYSRKT